MKEFDDVVFYSDEEVDKTIDALIKIVGDEIARDEEGVSMLDPIRYREMQFTYLVMKYFIGSGEMGPAKLTVKQNEPFTSMGSVSVEGRNLRFTKSELFARAAEFASNTDVYPLTNGDVRLTFTFHNLTRKVG